MRGTPWLAVALLAAAGCERPAPDFSTAHARRHIEQLAGVIGSRPPGTPANAAARAYLADALTSAGYTVRIQTADATSERYGVSGRVNNIIAVKDGARPEAIGLVAHYDSVAEGSGAADDGIGTAVCLEAGRWLAAGPRQWSTMVMLTDAEEPGLLGAEAVVGDLEVRSRLKAVINIESIGADAPVLLFETGPASGWIVDAWARAVPRPRGASFNHEIYRRMPNDTDFTVFKSAGIPGVNLAAVGDMYAYHTAGDVPARVTDRALADAGTTVVALAEALQRQDITTRTETSATYFDLLGLWALAWSPRVDELLAAVAILAGLVAIARVFAACWRQAGLRGVFVDALWTIAGLALVVGAAIGSVALLRAVREVYHPWYASPGRFATMIVLAGASAAWLLYRLGAHVPQGLRLPRMGVFVWLPLLVAWVALAALAASTAPRAAYLWVLPLVACAVPIAVGGTRRVALQVAAWLALLAGLVLWLPDTLMFFRFVVALLGTLPIVAPVWALPALLLCASAIVAPPLVALLVEGRQARPRFLTRALLVALGFSVGWAYASPAYTPERPLRVGLLAVRSSPGTAAEGIIVVTSNEPGLDLGRDGPELAPATTLPEPIERQAPDAPFRFAGIAPPPDAFGTVSCEETPVERGVELAAHVTPAIDGLSARLEVPGTVLGSSWPGRTRGGWWSAGFAGVPPEGVTFRVRLPASRAGRACDGRVVLRRPRPVDPATGALPRWLSRPGLAWSYRVVDIVALR